MLFNVMQMKMRLRGKDKQSVRYIAQSSIVQSKQDNTGEYGKHFNE